MAVGIMVAKADPANNNIVNVSKFPKELARIERNQINIIIGFQSNVISFN